MPVVDAHAHVYSEDEVGYPPIENPLRPPKKAGTIEHLMREMRVNRVSKAVGVQISTFYGWDNRYVCYLSKEYPEWYVGVVTLNPDDPNSPDLLSSMVHSFGIRGLRSVSVDGKYDEPGVRRLWQKALELEIVVNAMIPLNLADELAHLLENFPGLRVVLDHCFVMKAGETLSPTLKKVLELAHFSNLYAKLTFIPIGSEEPFPCRDLHEACKRVLEAYGADRCIWGSNFPCELWCPRVSYGQHLQIFTHELSLTDHERRAVLGDTSRKLWFGEQ